MEQKKLRHVVLFKFKPVATDADKEMVAASFSSLAKEVPGVDNFEWGTDVSLEGLGQGFTHCFILTFHDEKDRDAYLPYPAHQAFAKMIGPFVEVAFVVDYWVQ